MSSSINGLNIKKEADRYRKFIVEAFKIQTERGIWI